MAGGDSGELTDAFPCLKITDENGGESVRDGGCVFVSLTCDDIEAVIVHDDLDPTLRLGVDLVLSYHVRNIRLAAKRMTRVPKQTDIEDLSVVGDCEVLQRLAKEILDDLTNLLGCGFLCLPVDEAVGGHLFFPSFEGCGLEVVEVDAMLALKARGVVLRNPDEVSPPREQGIELDHVMAMVDIRGVRQPKELLLGESLLGGD